MARVIAFIPVRGGSLSIPLKNIKELAGKPLVLWTAEAASQCSLIDEVIIATDSNEIKNVVENAGLKKTVIFERSADNATNTASTESVMLEYLENKPQNDDTLFILVQATSPFTESEHFEEAIRKLQNGNKDSLLSCVKSKRFFWSDNGTPINYDFKNRPRRQNFPGWYMENGAFYISRVQDIIRNQCRLSGSIELYEMPDYTGLEIDEQTDWSIAAQFLKCKSRRKDYTQLKIVLSDVDGVLTDGSMYYSEQGDELKKFSTYDGVGFRLLKEMGMITGIITSEKTELVARRANKMQIDYCIQGAFGKAKLQAAIDICTKHHLTLENVAYIGDDVGDEEVLRQVGFPFCPANAVKSVKEIPNIQSLSSTGGAGCIREIYESVI